MSSLRLVRARGLTALCRAVVRATFENTPRAGAAATFALSFLMRTHFGPGQISRARRLGGPKRGDGGEFVSTKFHAVGPSVRDIERNRENHVICSRVVRPRTCPRVQRSRERPWRSRGLVSRARFALAPAPRPAAVFGRSAARAYLARVIAVGGSAPCHARRSGRANRATGLLATGRAARR